MPSRFEFAFFHPTSRIVVALLCMHVGLMSYAIDPVSSAMHHAELRFVGRVISIIFQCLEGSVFGIFFLGGSLFLGAALGGLVHDFLRDIVQLAPFGYLTPGRVAAIARSGTADSIEAERRKGRFTVKSIVASGFLYVMTRIGAFLCETNSAGVGTLRVCSVTDELPVSYATFMAFCAGITWGLDFLSLALLVDTMATEASLRLRERAPTSPAIPAASVSRGINYRFSCSGVFLRYMERRDELKIVLLLGLIIIFANVLGYGLFVVVAPIVGPFSEFTRVFVASLRLLLDTLFVMQDWEFPTFEQTKRISVGLFESHVTGKWLNFGVLAMTLLLDLNSVRFHLTYSPGQYDQVQKGSTIIINNSLPESKMPLFYGYSFGAKLIFAFPVLLGVVLLVLGVKLLSIQPTRTPPLSYSKSEPIVQEKLSLV